MTTAKITYCLNGCTVRSGKERIRARATAPSSICTRCEEDIKKWLREIPDNYALLPTFIEPGSAETNPESKTTKAAVAPLPVRLEVLDLLDQRLGRIWNGLAPAHDRRGVIGTLAVHVERLRDERPLTTGFQSVTVSKACALLERHRLWIGERDWAPLLHEDLKNIHRALSDAIGDYRRPPVGRCSVLVGDDDPRPCAGSLRATDYGGVICGRCGSTWDTGQLRLLGMTLNKEADAG